MGRDGPQLALSVCRRCGVVGVAADAAHPREHVWRVALGEDGKQRGARAIGYPDNQAGRIDDAGRALEQPRELRRVAYTREVGAEASRGGEMTEAAEASPAPPPAVAIGITEAVRPG